jgi:hypothetical protein
MSQFRMQLEGKNVTTIIRGRERYAVNVRYMRHSRWHRGSVRGGGLEREPHRHQRFLRSACNQSESLSSLHPYPDDLVIVTKVGARCGADGSWHHAGSRQEIIDTVHDNLRNLGSMRCRS